jgi:hypothetical protein
MLKVSTTRQKPKSKSSIGAKTKRPFPINVGGECRGVLDPIIAFPSYSTIPKPVKIPLVINWKKITIEYEAQKTLRFKIFVRKIKKSKAITISTPKIVSWV